MYDHRYMTTSQNTKAAVINRDKLVAAIDANRAEVKRLVELNERLEAELAKAEREVLAAEAADASDSLPVGTRVCHRTFTIFATVVESDGTGIALVLDGAQSPVYGYGPDEWLRVYGPDETLIG